MLKTEANKPFTMPTNRRLAIYVIAVAILAVAGTSLSMAWISSLSLGITPMADLNITDVQFNEDYVTIEVKNQGNYDLIIREVRVNNFIESDQGLIINQTSTPYFASLQEPISVGEQISIKVSFNWISGYIYEVSLKTANTTYWTPAGMTVVVAP